MNMAEPGTDIVETTRARLGAVGVWSEVLKSVSIDDQRMAAARVEALGYRSLWWGEGVAGRDAFVHAAVVLSSSTTLMAGTGIANMWRDTPLLPKAQPTHSKRRGRDGSCWESA